MELRILDLREQRCPLSLLFVKRKIQLLEIRAALTECLFDMATKNDIEVFKHHFGSCFRKMVNDGSQIDVIEGCN